MGTIDLTPNTPVIVTGGASGIGRACAKALAAINRPVALWDIDGKKVLDEAETLRAKYSVNTVGLKVDVKNLAEIATAAEKTRELFGRIGGLVHAAGVSGFLPLAQFEAAEWASIMDINLRSFAFTIKLILKDLTACEGSAIVGIASINAALGNRINPVYSASKSGMLGLSRALADDLAQHRIRINCVSPGHIITPMLETGLEVIPSQRQDYESQVLLGRLGEPEEVANVVRFLLSSEASYITAAEFVVDGGNISSQRLQLKPTLDFINQLTS